VSVDAVWTFRCDVCDEKVAEGHDSVTAVDLAESVGAVVSYGGIVYCAAYVPDDVITYSQYAWKGTK
jgi:hypothetical protein